MSEDLISRKEAYKVLTSYFNHHTDIQHKTLRDALKRVPDAERKKGKWISNDIDPEAWNFCSVCGEQAIDLFDFCPNCGADMKGGDDDTD